jgi:hypothetical protein
MGLNMTYVAFCTLVPACQRPALTYHLSLFLFLHALLYGWKQIISPRSTCVLIPQRVVVDSKTKRRGTHNHEIENVGQGQKGESLRHSGHVDGGVKVLTGINADGGRQTGGKL